MWGRHSGIVRAMRGSFITHGGCLSMSRTYFLAKHCSGTGSNESGEPHRTPAASGWNTASAEGCYNLKSLIRDETRIVSNKGCRNDEVCSAVVQAYIELVPVFNSHGCEVEVLPMVGPEPGVHELAQKRVMEQGHDKWLVILQLVVEVDADSLIVPTKRPKEHDQSRHHRRPRIMCAQHDDTA